MLRERLSRRCLTFHFLETEALCVSFTLHMLSVFSPLLPLAAASVKRPLYIFKYFLCAAFLMVGNNLHFFLPSIIICIKCFTWDTQKKSKALADTALMMQTT